VSIERAAVADARQVVKAWPRLVRVVLFVAVAVVAALAGTLDDWVRVLLAVLFAALAITFLVEAVEGLRAARPGEGVAPPTTTPPATYPTGQQEVPVPDAS
jgi:hypothetical protein